MLSLLRGKHHFIKGPPISSDLLTQFEAFSFGFGKAIILPAGQVAFRLICRSVFLEPLRIHNSQTIQDMPHRFPN